MIILFVSALIVATVITWLLFRYGDSGYEGSHFLALVLALPMSVATGVSAVSSMFIGYGWIASWHQTNILNREYGTAYTREEVFFASDVIDTVRQLDRKRFEINGDLARESTAKDKP